MSLSPVTFSPTPNPPTKPDPRPTPPTPPRIIETSGEDLPNTILGTIENVDVLRSAYWYRKGGILNHCVVAMAIRRMFPFLPVERISIGLSSATLGGRKYYYDYETLQGIAHWVGGYDASKFNFTLRAAW